MVVVFTAASVIFLIKLRSKANNQVATTAQHDTDFVNSQRRLAFRFVMVGAIFLTKTIGYNVLPSSWPGVSLFNGFMNALNSSKTAASYLLFSKEVQKELKKMYGMKSSPTQIMVLSTMNRNNQTA